VSQEQDIQGVTYGDIGAVLAADELSEAIEEDGSYGELHIG
jgi:hypothetical protein